MLTLELSGISQNEMVVGQRSSNDLCVTRAYEYGGLLLLLPLMLSAESWVKGRGPCSRAQPSPAEPNTLVLCSPCSTVAVTDTAGITPALHWHVAQTRSPAEQEGGRKHLGTPRSISADTSPRRCNLRGYLEGSPGMPTNPPRPGMF